MATCKQCEREMGFADRMNAKSYGGLCVSCTSQAQTRHADQASGISPEEFAQRDADLTRQKAEAEQLRQHILKVSATTEASHNLKVLRRIDIITSQAAFEINNFKDIVVGFMNPVKGRANEMEKQIDLLKDKAMYDLKAKAHQLNANGVVGVDLDISTVTIGQISMLMLVASGTAVVIED